MWLVPSKHWSVPPERRSLPVAFDKNAIVQKLVEIANTDEDGIVHEQTAVAVRSMTETFLNRLSLGRELINRLVGNR
jgi:hypothetical protein